MSVRMMAKVWELDLPQPLKLLALALADTGNDEGENIWPSKGYLAWKVCASSRTVQRQLADLEARGIVEVVADKGHRLPSGQWTRLLKLHPERGDRLSPLVRKGETPTDGRGDTGDQKGRHGYVSLSVSETLDNRDDFTFETEHPRLLGESHIDYFRRLAKMLDK